MAKLRDSNTSQHGLTLVGVLVATLVFSIMLIAVTQLMARSQKTVGISREEFIAVNLAREDLELVQYVRDSNWLSRGHTNPQGIINPPDHPWISHPYLNGRICFPGDTKRTQTIEYDSTVGATIVHSGKRQLSLTADGRYVNHNGTGTPTPFSRAITIDCTNEATAGDQHIVVTSEVTWTSRGQARHVTISTKLYDWYQ